ncbi:putative membrane protein [Francisella tularensis]|nr:putative membrane protein [Francisella tularensis]
MQLLKLKLLLLLFLIFLLALFYSIVLVLLYYSQLPITKPQRLKLVFLRLVEDLTIAVVSFSICSFIPRFGYKNSMLTGLAIITIGCITMVTFDSF